MPSVYSVIFNARSTRLSGAKKRKPVFSFAFKIFFVKSGNNSPEIPINPPVHRKLRNSDGRQTSLWDFPRKRTTIFHFKKKTRLPPGFSFRFRAEKRQCIGSRRVRSASLCLPSPHVQHLEGIMKKIRRSLMVFLFITLVFGCGLFLPGGVSKTVNAAPDVKVEVRSSKNQNWAQVLELPYAYTIRGYAPFDWVTIAVTQPRAFPNANTPPRTLSVRGDFADFYGELYPAWLNVPFSTYETPTTVTYFYRFDASPARGGLKEKSSASRIIVRYDSNGDGNADRHWIVSLPK
jgi:hypothetical protein